MPVRSLDSFAHERRLFKVLPLYALKDTRIGIDAVYYFNKILSTPQKKESLTSAFGGLPCSLIHQLDLDLLAFSSNNITPVFVFNGLKLPVELDVPFNYSSPAHPSGSDEIQAQKRVFAWESLENSKNNNNNLDSQQQQHSLSLFADIDSVRITDRIQRCLIYLLKARSIEFLVAPYMAFAELAYLYSNDLIDSIMGPHEVLFYDVDKLITSIDLRNNNSNGSIVYINRRAILSELGSLSPDAFTETCILSGSDISQTFPLLEKPNIVYAGSLVPVPSVVNLRATADLVRTYPNAYSAISAYSNSNSSSNSNSNQNQYQNQNQNQTQIQTQTQIQNHSTSSSNIPSDDDNNEEEYMHKFRNACGVVRHHAIITKTGQVEPLKPAEAPNDTHEFLGQRLPDEVYFYISRGVIGTSIADALVSGKWVLWTPLDGGDYIQSQNVVNSYLIPILAQSLNLFTQPLHRYFQFKKIFAHVWFNHSNPIEISHRVNPPVSTLISYWNTSQEVLDLKLLPNIDITFATLISALEDEKFASKTIYNKSQNPVVLKTDAEIVSNVLFKVLQLRGYIDSETHKLTPWGKALASCYLNFSSSLTGTNLTVEESAAFLVAFELIRSGNLTNNSFTFSSSRNKKATNNTTNNTNDNKSSQAKLSDDNYVSIISRIATFVSLPVSEFNPLKTTSMSASFSNITPASSNSNGVSVNSNTSSFISSSSSPPSSSSSLSDRETLPVFSGTPSPSSGFPMFLIPLSRELLAFRSITDFVSFGWRSLIDSIFVNTSAAAGASGVAFDRLHRTNEEWSTLGVESGLRVFASPPPSVATGLAVKAYFDELANSSKHNNQSSENGKADKIPDDEIKRTLNSIKALFPNLHNVPGSIGRAFQFWDAIIEGIKVAHKFNAKYEDGIDGSSILNTFNEADKWLNSRRPINL